MISSGYISPTQSNPCFSQEVRSNQNHLDTANTERPITPNLSDAAANPRGYISTSRNVILRLFMKDAKEAVGSMFQSQYAISVPEVDNIRRRDRPSDRTDFISHIYGEWLRTHAHQGVAGRVDMNGRIATVFRMDSSAELMPDLPPILSFINLGTNCGFPPSSFSTELNDLADIVRRTGFPRHADQENNHGYYLVFTAQGDLFITTYFHVMTSCMAGEHPSWME